MSTRDKAKVAMTNTFNEVAAVFQKKNRFKMTKSRFKRSFGASAYSPHQNRREMERRLKNYPSLNLAIYRR
jgi:hypothetical protein